MPSDLAPNPALVSRSGYADVAPRNSRSVNRCGHAHLACQFPINVTVPSDLLLQIIEARARNVVHRSPPTVPRRRVEASGQ